jgi:hypothetical protein
VRDTEEAWTDVCKNLVKARHRWAFIYHVLIHEGSNPHVTALFYKAIVTTTLLFGFKTSVVTPSMLDALKKIHRKIARRIKRRAPVYLRWEGQWSYLTLGNAKKKAGLLSVDEYITRRRNGIVDFGVTQPLHALCCNSETPACLADHLFS